MEWAYFKPTENCTFDSGTCNKKKENSQPPARENVYDGGNKERIQQLFFHLSIAVLIGVQIRLVECQRELFEGDEII